MAPGLSWANGGTDGGDLITAAATGGVAHPTGYPTYLLVASLFQRMPVGTLAFRTNLLSAVAAVLASVVVYGTMIWLPNSTARGNWLAGMIAGFHVWTGAAGLVAGGDHRSVYAARVFRGAGGGPGGMDPDAQAARGLGRRAGGDPGAGGGQPPDRDLVDPGGAAAGEGRAALAAGLGRAAAGLAGLAGGLLVYAALPLRALGNPPVNWGNPVTLGQFTWLVTGDLYQRRLLDIPTPGLCSGCRMRAV